MTTDHKPRTGALAEFLLARIAEDEAVANAVMGRWIDPLGDWTRGPDPVASHIARWDPARVLAECEAKRRIVEIHGNGDAWCDYCAGYAEGLQDECHTGRLLALPYADHESFREEWKP